jgi:hypothetical protein
MPGPRNRNPWQRRNVKFDRNARALRKDEQQRMALEHWRAQHPDATAQEIEQAAQRIRAMP